MTNPELLSPEAWAQLPPAIAFLGIALATWLLEDLTLVASATLWSQGLLDGGLVLAANVVGISTGDIMLYVLGRVFGPSLPGAPLIGRFFKPASLERGTRFFRRRGLSLVLLARFVPGLRLPTYTAAGIFRAPFLKTAIIIIASGLLWVPLQMLAVRELGRHLSAGWGALAAVTVFLGMAWFIRGFEPREWRLRWLDLRRWTRFEFWPPWLFYLPVAVPYIRLGLKHGSLLLPSLANPGLDGGGLIGESKDGILRLLPPDSTARLEHSLWPAGTLPREILHWAAEKGLALPLILKPDLGQRGAGVRLIRDENALATYCAQARYAYIAQEYCDFEREAGLFYVKVGEAEPFLFSVTDKLFPTVTGDGRRSLATLILDHPRARWMARRYFERFAERLEDVPKNGESLRLVESGNHAQGAHFVDGARLASPALLTALDDLARSVPGFYVGRFDVRYRDEESLMRGEEFKVVELNGAGAEATHIWDPDFKLWDAYQVMAEQWRLLFDAGAWQRRKGLEPMSVKEFFGRSLAYRRLSKLYPPAT